MNENKLLPTCVVLGLAAILFVIPPPASLKLASWQKTATAVTDEQTAEQVAKRLEAGTEPALLADDLGIQAADLEEIAATPQRAWQLFVIFAATILLILLNTMPIFVAAIGGLSTAILSGTLTPSEGFSGFSNSTIILIVVAFTIAIGVAKSGLGARLAWIIISRFGSSTLGLGYSLIVTDLIIAPAFPSNTARSGVLFPIVDSVARGSGSPPEDRKKLGAFLMMASITGLSLSSAAWLTAMSANPAGTEVAADIADVTIDFLTWLKAACVPTLLAVIIVPWLLYRVFPPTVKQTPNAPLDARAKLTEMGPLSRHERIMATVFIALVSLWALSKPLNLNLTAVAIAGLFVLMATRVITLDAIRGSNGPSTFVWFGALFTLSTFLNSFGFMQWVGSGVASVVSLWPWAYVYVTLILAYVLIHYFFVSQTAHMYAVMPIFLSVGVETGVPGGLLAMMLLLATNFFSTLTPQASSANAIFVGSGYLTMGEVYKYGGFVTLMNTIIYLGVGTFWVQFVLHTP